MVDDVKRFWRSRKVLLDSASDDEFTDDVVHTVKKVASKSKLKLRKAKDAKDVPKVSEMLPPPGGEPDTAKIQIPQPSFIESDAGSQSDSTILEPDLVAHGIGSQETVSLPSSQSESPLPEKPCSLEIKTSQESDEFADVQVPELTPETNTHKKRKADDSTHNTKSKKPKSEAKNIHKKCPTASNDTTPTFKEASPAKKNNTRSTETKQSRQKSIGNQPNIKTQNLTDPDNKPPMMNSTNDRPDHHEYTRHLQLDDTPITKKTPSNQPTAQSPQIGLRLGLSRNGRFKSLHRVVQPNSK